MRSDIERSRYDGCQFPFASVGLYRSVMPEMVEVVDEFTKALAGRDVDRAVKLYAEDAVVVRYEGVAVGTEQVRAFLVGFLSTYERFELVSLDPLQRSDDTIVWDASIEIGAGVLLATNVFLLDGDGRIARHVPLVRGYWGRT